MLTNGGILKFIKGILITVNIIFLLGLFGCYSAYFINPSDYWFISLLGLGYYIWLIANLAIIIIWIFIKWKYSLVSLVAILIGLSYHSKMFAFHLPSPGDTKNDRIRVMSYNIQLFKYYDWKKNEIQRDKIIDFISKNDADVYCFQEYFQTRNQEFITTEKMKEILPEHTMHFEAGVVKYNNQEFGLATFSKFPILHSGYITIDSTKNRTNLVIYTDLLIKKDTIRVYNVHLASNHLNTNEVDSIMNTSEKSIFFAKKWMKKLKNGYKRRYEQVNILANHLKRSPYSTIIAGDFNDVPMSYTYRIMNRKYRDAFIESGSGIGATYNGNLPMLRIDYIFHTSDFDCKRFKVYPQSTTDHYPIMADFYLSR